MDALPVGDCRNRLAEPNADWSRSFLEALDHREERRSTSHEAREYGR